ncbi:ribosome silencing factor [Arachnia rubra]|uniref:Ribosomal silencing factor RsfS n=1 Tax=Arachnia rubra TaxID=1547448 RepID=A0ABX7Y8H7_9ACTN|nr:ribosome silencing factor [Arachnia rubra]MBB1572097.1 ribosome silencing factor [Propionibacterium sp.]MBB1577732.1 ribosome silencing factor [Propionibacterium sp.]QUC09362.1 ribosome silencing factor [Arachnia rubra]BCR80844.1 ribosomal silencing factor RsfS [Arachnia rubra]
MTTPESVIAHVTIAAEAAAGKFGTNIVAFDVSQQLAITDVFLIVSAKNERQVAAVVEAVEEQLIKQAELKPVRREGDRENRWVLLDYIDFVVHVQHTEERSLYNLERLWKDCPQIPLEVDEIPQDDDQ